MSAVLFLAAGAVPLATYVAPDGAAAQAGLTCTDNHWIRDVSDGNKVVGVGPASRGYQLEDDLPGYPVGHIFMLCSKPTSVVHYLQNQIPASGTPNGKLWVGVNVAQHYAIDAGATGPGPHEAFTVVCAGSHQEFLHWVFEGDDTFTIATQPPTVWTSPPSFGLPGTLYNISGMC
jgi:hypothetical protein